MPFDMPRELPSQWQDFLLDIDRQLTQEVRVHCLGGFVVALFSPVRSTGDLDYIETIPHAAAAHLQEVAGKNSELHKKHNLHVQNVGVASVPQSYEERLVEVFPGRFRYLRLFVLDPYDLVLSKLTRNHPVDQADVEFLAKHVPLDPEILRDRYEREFRSVAIGDPDWNRQTLDLWIEEYFTRE
jgi:hypothetical protein